MGFTVPIIGLLTMFDKTACKMQYRESNKESVVFKCYFLLTCNYKTFVHEVIVLAIRLTYNNVTLGTASSPIVLL